MSVPIPPVKVTDWALKPSISTVAPSETATIGAAVQVEDDCAALSTITLAAAGVAPVSPDQSAAVAVKAFAERANVSVVKLQNPAASACVVPSSVVLSKMLVEFFTTV